jgi:ribosome-associated translation inhibitor RaiA
MEQLFFDHCPREMRESVRGYWAQKHARLDRLLRTFPEDQRSTRVAIRPWRIGWDVRISLALPTGTLVSDTEATSWEEGLDLAVDRLTFEIRRHKEFLRHDSGDRRKGRRAAVRR